MICSIHDRWTPGDTCAGCEGRSISPDLSLVASWDSAIVDAHERNRLATNYQIACWIGDKAKTDALASHMQALITKSRLEKLKSMSS